MVSLAQLPSYHVLVSAGVDRDAYVWNPFVSTLVTKLVGTLFVPLQLFDLDVSLSYVVMFLFYFCFCDQDIQLRWWESARYLTHRKL